MKLKKGRDKAIYAPQQNSDKILPAKCPWKREISAQVLVK